MNFFLTRSEVGIKGGKILFSQSIFHFDYQSGLNIHLHTINENNKFDFSDFIDNKRICTYIYT